jgi:predicted DNA-binding transcriptional regulator AlpA
MNMEIPTVLDPADFLAADEVLKKTGMSRAKLWRRCVPWQEARVPGRVRFAVNEIDPRTRLYFAADLRVVSAPRAGAERSARGRKRKIFARCAGEADLRGTIAQTAAAQRELTMRG